MAQMWRISNDIWDVWSSRAGFPRTVKDQFALAAKWSSYAGPGHWPDADMLPLGRLAPYPDVGKGARETRLTPAEQQTQVTLWSFARSPLIVGANLTELEEPTLKLLTNRDILRIDQTSLGSREVHHDGDIIVWTSDLPKGEFAVAVFNIGDNSAETELQFSALKLPHGSFHVTNIWDDTDAGKISQMKVSLAPHASAAFLLRK